MAQEETTVAEVVRRIREGTFYEDYDWAAGPALRVLERMEAMTRLTRGCLDAMAQALNVALADGFDGGVFDEADRPDFERARAWVEEEIVRRERVIARQHDGPHADA